MQQQVLDECRSLDRRQGDEARERENDFLRALLDQLAEGVVVRTADGGPLLINRVARDLLGLSGAAATADQWSRGHRMYEVDGRTPLPEEQTALARALRGETVRDQIVVLVPNGRPPRTVVVSGGPIVGEDGRSLGAAIAFRDVTDQQRIALALIESERRLREAQSIAHVGSWEWDIARDVVTWTDELYRIFGLQPAQFKATYEGYLNVLHPEDRDRVNALVQGAFASGDFPSFEHRLVRPDGSVRVIHASGRVERDAAGRPVKMSGIAQDVTEHRQAEAALHEGRERLAQAQEIAHLGSWEWNITQNTVTWTDELYRIHGLSPGEFEATYEGYLARVHPDDRPRVHEAVQRAYRTQAPFEFEERVVRPSGEVRWLYNRGRVTTDARGQPVRMTGVCQDITASKRAANELAARAEALQRSNEELEQFAYVASHDLQEPLRTVASYTQLLERRFGRSDAKAQEFVRFITDGVYRMQALIADLLTYSRVARGAVPLVTTDLDDALRDALANLEQAVRDSGAVVTRDGLPTVLGDRSQLAQVFQNLLSNAIKFHGAEPPRVHIEAALRDGQWLISVRDNGIGIEPAHFEKMFVLFQRLHVRDRYPGTGLGLAICKKIITRHGGRIWVESQGLGKGATFYFALPEMGPA